MSEFLEHYDSKFAPRLAHRAAGFRALFVALERVRDTGHVIVETGCLRQEDNWAGDGQSTVLFSCFASHHDAIVWSVDTSAAAVRIASRLCGSHVNVMLGDAARFLSHFVGRIDLLYLDSEGTGSCTPYQAIFELCAASRCLATGSIVAVDDTYRDGQGRPTGKGELVAQYMEQVGRKPFIDDYQMAWRIP